MQRFLRALKYFICINLYHSWLNNKENYGGKVPASTEKLTQIDRVGGKTANVVLRSAFEIPGIIVDTHIKRLAGRLGLSHKSDLDKIEADLMNIVPEPEWTYFSSALSDHGRLICQARKPLYPKYKINHLCPSWPVLLAA